MAFSVEFSASVNCLHWVRSLYRHEWDWGTRFLDRIRATLDTQMLPLHLHEVHSPDAFRKVMGEIAHRAETLGERPILQIDMHGWPDRGLELAPDGDHVSWAETCDLLRRINVITQNNLLVISAACHGIRAIFDVQIDKPCPFALLIGPRESIGMEYVANVTCDFYAALMNSNNVVAAYEAHLRDQMQMFNAERAYARALQLYILNHCIGDGASQRVERLIEQIKSETPLTAERELELKTLISEKLEPSQELIDRWGPTFLIGRPVPFGIEDIMKTINAATA